VVFFYLFLLVSEIVWRVHRSWSLFGDKKLETVVFNARKPGMEEELENQIILTF